MKFTWFNLMPWPYLPDDFREKNRSVWVASSLSGAFDRCIAARTAYVVVALPWSIWPIGPPGMKDQLG
ncbi:hypothetical protein [Phenylobacterium sp.]|jgi:hypothetical protein|uniref:hypothetical protein n=1 Tax=Phenylobacterium sp. TaxID=1871053 RepID=UPI0037C87DC1